jgi:hypothetical protein
VGEQLVDDLLKFRVEIQAAASKLTTFPGL